MNDHVPEPMRSILNSFADNLRAATVLRCDKCHIEELPGRPLTVHPCGHRLCPSCCCPGIKMFEEGHVCRCSDYVDDSNWE